MCLIITDMGVFENASESQITIESGRAAILEFPSIESEPPPSVIWQDENGALRYDQKYVVTDTHQLVILCVSKEDEKAYRFVMILLMTKCLISKKKTVLLQCVYSVFQS